MATQFSPSYADAVDRPGVPFLWLCGPPGVGKSVVGYEIFTRVCRSGIKASFLDFDQVGLCYPTPSDDPVNHRVKAQNLAAVWPTYRTAGARCLIAVGSVASPGDRLALREQSSRYRPHAMPAARHARTADLCIDTDNQNVAQVAQRIRTRMNGWPRLTPDTAS